MSVKSISGSYIVDEISRMNINSIPEAWYRTIKRNGYPHAMAILILWDLLYWYKWTEVRDERTGMVVGYKKKFKNDLLQRSYEAIAEKFGISYSQAKKIIIFLEGLGLVKRVEKSVSIRDRSIPHVLHIELVPSKIKEFSDVSNIISDENKSSEESDPSQSGRNNRPSQDGSSVPVGSDQPSQLGRTNTIITTTNSTTTSTSFFKDEQNEPDDDDLPPPWETNMKEAGLVKASEYKADNKPPVKKERAKTQKHEYGEFNNVFLSDSEYKKLEEQLGKEKTEAVIKNFSELKEMKGYKYKSDYLALKKWGINAYERQNQNGGYSKPFYQKERDAMWKTDHPEKSDEEILRGCLFLQNSKNGL